MIFYKNKIVEKKIVQFDWFATKFIAINKCNIIQYV